MFSLKKIGATLKKVVTKVVKNIVSPLAARFSTFAGNAINRPIAGKFFAASFVGGESSISKTITNKLGPTLKENELVKNNINSQVNYLSKNNKNTCSISSVGFTSGDLYLSVGKMDIVTSLIDMQDHYIVTVSFVDSYDFDEVRRDKTFGSIMNNAGYYLEKNNIIEPYDWDYTYSYFVKK